MNPEQKKKLSEEYWKANLIVVGLLLGIWALLSCVLSIWLVEPLNEITFAGFKLGFWIAQQGTMIGFVVLILVYALVMNRIDSKYEKQMGLSDGQTQNEKEDAK